LGRSPAADALVLSLVGKPLLAPQAGQPRPHATHVAWHSREVFRTPARQAVE
jgi:putative restriction endonuclease